jgi:hypothetical protein
MAFSCAERQLRPAPFQGKFHPPHSPQPAASELFSLVKGFTRPQSQERMRTPRFLLALSGGLALLSTTASPLTKPGSAPLPSRQVHLDFHTSELIPAVGSKFAKENWQTALKLGHVNWINVFAKCHHGWSYYPTKVGRQHPSLEIDLLGEEISASHELGVRCPIYFTVGWSVQDAEAHPEWRVRNKDGTFAARSVDFSASPEDPRPPTSWVFLCPAGDYLALLLRQTEEICQLYRVDGFFYDINNVSPPCFCDNCDKGMRAENIDLENTEAVAAYNARKWKHFFAEARKVIARYHPQATVFFNGTTKLQPQCLNYRMWEDNTQMELEDLPTTWGGYDKFPLRSKFFHNTGKRVFAMSGKFHTSWGEFGGFKHPDALRYEAAAMVAFGASCNFGDQLHPSGEMDLETYRNIGKAYEYVEKIEAYGVGARPVSRLGVWPTGSTMDDEGVSVMLMETHKDYVVVDPAKSFDGLDVIVLTGAAGMTQTHATKLESFVAKGGGLVVLGESALDAERKGFALDVGARYLGPARFTEDYLVAGRALQQGMVTTPFLDYRAAIRTEPAPGTEVLVSIREPYFNRTYATYCSHLNTPYTLTNAAHPGAVRKGRVVFLPHRLGEMYYTNGARLHRQFFANALNLIYTKPMVTAPLPSAGRITLLSQPDQKRYVAHLLYAPPLQRGRCLVIEDLPPLRDVPVELRVPDKIKEARLIPDNQTLPLKRTSDGVRVVVPSFTAHCAVVFSY